MPSEIKILRLCTGEEIICDVAQQESLSPGVKDYHLTDIAILIPTEQNSLGLAPFVPYSTASTDGITIQEKDVMFVTEPVNDLKKQYQHMFSRVVTPPQQKIIT